MGNYYSVGDFMKETRAKGKGKGLQKDGKGKGKDKVEAKRKQYRDKIIFGDYIPPDHVGAYNRRVESQPRPEGIVFKKGRMGKMNMDKSQLTRPDNKYDYVHTDSEGFRSLLAHKERLYYNSAGKNRYWDGSY